MRITVFAPHLTLPERNGADTYISRKWGALDPLVHSVQLVAADGVYALGVDGWEPQDGAARSSLRGKAAAAACVLLGGGDYLSARFNTPAYLSRALGGRTPAPDLAVYSFVSTWLHVAPRMPGARACLVETHNFEPKFYLDRAAEATGPARVAAAVAAARSQALLARLPKSVPLVALGLPDAQMYRAAGHDTVLLSSLGYQDEPPRSRFPRPGAVRIAFVGALSVGMNAAAIRTFVQDALPSLRQALDAPLELVVAGSRPSPALVALLRRHGAQVHADPSDAELADLLDACHATLLPFASSNGLKLKFASSAARGIPILSYIPAPPELEGVDSVLVSQDMARWAAFLQRLQDPSALARAAQELQGIVRGRTWRACAEANLQALAAVAG